MKVFMVSIILIAAGLVVLDWIRATRRSDEIQDKLKK
jgi:hypothetical protein